MIMCTELVVNMGRVNNENDKEPHRDKPTSSEVNQILPNNDSWADLAFALRRSSAASSLSSSENS